MARAEEVTAWMYAEFERTGELHQAEALAGIRVRFGAEFVAGGRIRRDVLAGYYALHAALLRRLDGPISPAMRRMERAHVGRLEQAICDTEGQIGQLEARAEHLPPGGG